MAQRSVNNERTQKKLRGESVSKGDDQSLSFYTGKRTAAGGKPARSSAAGVRVVQGGKASGKSSSSGKELTKEERKAEREARREKEDRIDIATAYLVRQDPEYAHMRKIWWGLLIAGFACILVSFVIQFVLQVNQSDALAAVAMVCLVLSYVGIFGAVLYDLFVINKVRKTNRAKVEGMSAKRVDKLLEQNRAERQAEIEAEGDGIVAKVKRFFRS